MHLSGDNSLDFRENKKYCLYHTLTIQKKYDTILTKRSIRIHMSHFFLLVGQLKLRKSQGLANCL